MKKKYRGFILEATREKCLGGWSQVYYSAYGEKDGFELICDFSEAEDSLSSFIEDMKSTVDDYYDNPEEYED